MTIRTLTSTAVGLSLLALAVPGTAFAKTGATADSVAPAATIRGIIVVAQDTGADKPKVEGWQTGAGDMAGADCQGLADQIDEAINTAIDSAHAGDMDSMFANLEFAEAVDSLAGESGCAISYPA